MISVKASKTKYLRLYSALTCTLAYLWIFTFEGKSNSASLLLSPFFSSPPFRLHRVGILSSSSWWASRECCQVHGDGGRQRARGRSGSKQRAAHHSLFITSVLMDTVMLLGNIQSRWEAHSAWDLLFTVLGVMHSLLKSEFSVGRTDLVYSVPLESISLVSAFHSYVCSQAVGFVYDK